MTTFGISVRSVSNEDNEKTLYLPLDWFINNISKQLVSLPRSLARSQSLSVIPSEISQIEGEASLAEASQMYLSLCHSYGELGHVSA